MKDGNSSSDIPRGKNTKKQTNSTLRWSITVLITSFWLSIVFNAISETALPKASLTTAFIILFAFIFLGILFDIFGIATTTASEKPFHAMSSRRVRGAREAIWIVKNAEKVSNFCNDVIGDICGIMSGSTSAVIIASLNVGGTKAVLISLFITGVVGGVTVGGKAFGKGFAIKSSNDIVFFMAKVLTIFKLREK